MVSQSNALLSLHSPLPEFHCKVAKLLARNSISEQSLPSVHNCGTATFLDYGINKREIQLSYRLHLHGNFGKALCSDRLSICTISWNRTLQNRFSQCSHTLHSSKLQPLSPFIRNDNSPNKFFSPYICSSKPYLIFSSGANFFSYRPLSFVEPPLASFLSVLDDKSSCILQENVFVPFQKRPTL